MRTIAVIQTVLLTLVAGPLQATPAQRPAYLIEIPERVAMVLVAETDTATLYRFSAAGDLLGEHYMSIGQNGVDKQRPWDRRTPLGIYFVNDKLDTSRLHERYGVLAFPLDYPNAWDRLREKSGDGIWVHGVDPNGGKRPERDTDGCIALPNADLLQIETQFQPLLTPVIVTRELSWQDPATIDALRQELVTAVDTWRASLAAGNWHEHLALYADSFEHRGLSKTDWATLALESLKPLTSVSLDDLILAADPEDDSLYLSRFRLSSDWADGGLTVTKRLYWRRFEDGSLRIVLEDNG